MQELSNGFCADYATSMINVTHQDRRPWHKIWDEGRGNSRRILYTLAAPTWDRMGQSVNQFVFAEPIYGEMSVTNNNYSIVLHSGGYCKDAKFEVRDSDGQIEFDSNTTMMCVVRPQPLTYAPYETKSHTESLSSGGSLPLGRHTVVALGGQFSALPPQADMVTCQATALSRTGSFVIQ